MVQVDRPVASKQPASLGPGARSQLFRARRSGVTYFGDLRNDRQGLRRIMVLTRTAPGSP